jgi:uncharacterized membrane protein YphA (DoxX/SURF4 family)
MAFPMGAARESARDPGTAAREDAALLVLRLGAGLSLPLLYGFRKALDLALFLSGGGRLERWGLTELVRGLGFPAPVFVALAATLNESLVPLLVAAGLLARSLAALVAIDMAVAFYLSLVPFREEPLRAFLYALLFAGIAIAGPGRFRLRPFPGGRP